MSSRRKRRRLRERAADRVAAALTERPTKRPATRKRTARPCTRCGGGCRTVKYPYGWMCGRCVKELDTYYLVLMGLRGGDVASLYAEDLRRGTVPTPGFEGVSDPLWLGR